MKAKNHKRDWIEIQSVLKRKRVTQRRIARRAKVHKSIVSRTIRGTKNNRKVLDALRRAGVPEHLLEARK